MRYLITTIIVLPLVLLGAQWQSLDGPPAGRADDMSMGWDPIHNYWVIYAADKTHKLYKSVNEGEFWDSISLDPHIVNPVCVICEPNDAQVVYIGKNDQTPVWKSVDGGETWSPKSYGITNTRPLCFAMDPNNSSVVYLGCQRSTTYEIFKTTDGGENWTGLANAPNSIVNEIEIISDPVEGTWIYAGCSNPPDKGIWKSIDGGNNWTQIFSDDDIYSIEFANKDIGYAGAISGIYKTTDGGANWVYLESSPQSRVNDLAIINTNTVYAATGDGMYKTSDGGANWDEINNNYRCKIALTLLVHPANNQTLFSGADWCIYKTINGGNEWFEIIKGYRPANLVSVTTNLPGMYVLGKSISSTLSLQSSSIFRSDNSGNNWITLEGYFRHFSADYRPHIISVSSELTNLVMFGGRRITVIESENAGTIFRSTDMGETWQQVYITADYPGTVYAIDFCPFSFDNVFAGLCSPPVVRSTDAGANWMDKSPPTASAYSLAINPVVDDIIYAGTEDGVYRSSNAGDNWTQTALNNVDVNALAIDFDHPDTLYAGSDNPNGIYKTIDGGDTWYQMNNGLDYLYIKDLEIDSEDPTIIYALCKPNASSDETYVYCTVDRAGKWFDVTAGLPTDKQTHDLEIDQNEPDPVYAATDVGIYTYTPDFNKHLVSSSSSATAFNNGRKMVRVENEIWVTYESGGVIYVVHSTDLGQTWSKKMEIGEGYYPALSIRANVPNAPPGVVWLAPGEQDTIYFSRYVGGDKWGDPVSIVISSSGVDFGPPSFAIGNDNYGHLSYNDNRNVYYTQFYIYNPESTPPERIGSGKNPSIGYMYTIFTPPVHIYWENNGRIYYRARYSSGSWGNVVDVMLGVHPSIEIVGNAAHIVCESFGDIYRRYVYYQGGIPVWSRIERICTTLDPSQYPELTGSSVCVWVESQPGNNEIYFSYSDPEQGWVPGINISNTDAGSNYPHLVHRQVSGSATVYFIWTERDNPPYDIIFHTYTIGGDENLGFYVVGAGDAVRSPFNVERAGYEQYGEEPYKRVDYSDAGLVYQFEGLDARRDYRASVYLYQVGEDNLPLSVVVDGMVFGGVVLPSDTLIVLSHPLPFSLYEDGEIDLRVMGNNRVVIGEIVLYEYEREVEGGGPQSEDDVIFGSSGIMLDVFPRPADGVVGIRYGLSGMSLVRVEVYDVMGRRVRCLVDKEVSAGRYQLTWDGCNAQGKRVSAGVYFVRLSTDKETRVEKAVLINR